MALEDSNCCEVCMLSARFFRLSVAFCAVALMGNQCGGTVQTGLPQTPGNFIILDQHHYPNFAGNVVGAGADADCLRNPDGPVVDSRAHAAGWTLKESWEDDPNCSSSLATVYASHFTDSTAQNADFIWFTGHGDNGRNVLYNYTPPNGDCALNANTQCFWGQSAGLPTGGRLKWIFAYASHNTDDQYWTNAFNQNAPGLEGYYGIEGEPYADRGGVLATEFFKAAIASPTRATIRDAWMNSVSTATGKKYGIWELRDSVNDPLSASGGQSSRRFTSGTPLQYTNSNDITYTIVPVQSLSDVSPGSYRPLALSTESYSDATLASQSNSYGGQPIAPYYFDSNTYHITGDDYTADHYEASQGVVVAGHHSLDPYNYTQADSQAFAESFMSQQGNPLPGDAVLQNVKVIHTTPQGGSPILMGYMFTYAHSNGTLGGDTIMVSVDNIKQRVCNVVNENDPPYNKPPCLQWGFAYNQHINYYYRLWRQPTSSLRYPLGQHGTGAAALSPNQAFSIVSASPLQIKGTVGTFLGYTYSYWTPGIESTDNTAYPAYHFYYSNNVIVSADAYTGVVLGIEG